MVGITGGNLIFVNDQNKAKSVSIDDCSIEYTRNGNNNRSGSYTHTVTTDRGTKTITSSWDKPNNYKYPWPNSEFYIVVDKAVCGDATILSEIQFEYQSTRTSGEGFEANHSNEWQPLLIVNKSSVYVERTNNVSDVNVRLTTDVTIDKYITKVERDGNVIYGGDSNTERTNKTIAWKQSNKVNVYDGDIVTFNIDLKNNQNVDVIFNLKDMLPSEYSYVKIVYSSDQPAVEASKVTNNEFDRNNIVIPKNSKATLIVSVTAKNKDNTNEEEYNNTAIITSRNKHKTKITTMNDTEIYSSDFPRTSSGATIVNIAELKNGAKLEDSDYYKVKPIVYNISVDKSIVNVKHNGDTSGKTYSRTNQTDTDKKNNPVYIEYGDRLTYNITITNNSIKEAYVDILDTLPKSYSKNNSGLTVKIGNNNASVTKTDNSFKLNNIKVDANKTTTVEVSFSATTTVNEEQLPDENKVIIDKIKNSNKTEVENKSTKTSSSDYNKFKQYNVNIDKYIVKVEHTGNNQVVYNDANGRKNLNTEVKNANPVYVEFGDRVTYNIDLYNTASDTEEEKTDSIMAKITDTLPANYSDLKVSIAGNNKEVQVNGNTFTLDNIEIKNNGKVTVTVSLIVNSSTKTIQEENSVTVNKITNVNNREVTNTSPKGTSSDYYHLNDYNVSINKYISNYNQEMTKSNNDNRFTSEAIKNTSRKDMTEEDKNNKPLAVEKTETIEYSIVLKNNSVAKNGSIPSGVKPATSVRTTDIRDIMDYGLEYKSVSAKVYKNDNSEKYKNELQVTVTPLDNNSYQFSINKDIILDPGEYIVYYVNVQVTESNMYLFRLANMGTITTLTNINHTDSTPRIVTNENVSEKKSSIEYVKLKDLVISGKVWLDSDKNGYMGKGESGRGKLNSYIDFESTPSTNIVPPSEDTEYAMEGITVKLYSVDNPTPVRITKTDVDGLFTFGKYTDDDNKLQWYPGEYSYNGSTESEQRIPKATNKDVNMNYTDKSELIQYYIEYEYDGLVYKSTEVYSEMKNLNSDGSLKDNYKYDSNATEFKAVRDEFDKSYEIIAYNKAIGFNGEEKTISYQKAGHNSYLNVDTSRIMTARSFVTIKDNKQENNYLWLFKQGNNYDKPETEYLKYINLGLEEREDINLSVVQDVYEIHNTINGEEMTYEFNQNSFAKGGTKIDHNNSSTEAFSSEFYMTGFEDNTSALTPYKFKYYLSDYNYKVEQNENTAIQNYKGQESELNSEVTFRIRVKNNAISNDEPYLADDKKDIKVYAGINEVIEYFDNQFININEDGTVNTITVKTKDDNGYLVNTELKIVEAKFVLSDGTTIPAILSSSSYYDNVDRKIDRYNTLYIRPESQIILEEGNNVDILIKFTVDKDEERNLKLGLKTAISEIVAYSTYYKNADGTYYPAGLVDANSNPGNFGEKYKNNKNEEISFNKDKNNIANDPYLEFYEDDTYKTGIDLIVDTPTGSDDPPGDPGNPPAERTIEGQVWDDARSNIAKTTDGKDTTDGIQYIGDGLNGTVDGINSEPANDNAKLNTIFGEIEAYKNKEQEKNDFAVDDVGVKLVEIVRIPQFDGENITGERIYEQTIKASGDKSIVNTRTTDGGKYQLKGYIPGEYIVRFSYGDKDSDQMAIFNGQDYKSTTYQNGIPTYADEAYLGEQKDVLGNRKKDTDNVLAILETKGLSDAKDDEIRRLEAISYSETLTNSKILSLRGINSSNRTLQVEKTSMNAETTDFLVRTEKADKSKTKLTYEETIDKMIAVKRHPIENIDFGLQYRPEQQVGLNKFIKNLTIRTSDATSESTMPLVNAKFNEYYGVVVDTDSVKGITTFLSYKNENNEDEIIRIPEEYLSGDKNSIKQYVQSYLSEKGKNERDLNSSLDKCKLNPDGTYQIIIAGTELDTENSIGLSNLQYMPNTLDSHDEDSIQGFVYLNIDDKIMQGAQINVQYIFTGHNLSEIDRVNKNLSLLRLKDNEEVTKYAKVSTGEGIYSGALTARDKLYNNYYNTDEEGKLFRTKKYSIGVTTDDYYGSYLGSTYYTGKVSPNDVVAELKIDEILDYVDNNLVFKQEDNQGLDNAWGTVTSSELALSGKISPEILEFESDKDKESIKNSGLSINNIDKDLLGRGLLLDSKGVAYNTQERSNLALMLNERTSDNQTENIRNIDISKFLAPRDSKGQNSFGKVKIVTSRTISAEDDTSEMNYENIGEIVQFSSVTGRVTNLATTLGNAKVDNKANKYNNSSEYEGAKHESDTASVEKITLTPPTGLNRTNRIIKSAVKGASYVGIVIVIIAVIGLGTLGGIKLYRNRKIK